MKLLVLAASILALSAQDASDLAARVKVGEGWGTSAVTSREVAECWATWKVLRDHIAQNGRGSFPADYTTGNLDKRIADWNRAVQAAFAAYPGEQDSTTKAMLEKVRGEVSGTGLGSRAEWSGACKKLPEGITSSVTQTAAAPAPAPAPAASSGSSESPAVWRQRGKAYAKGEGVAKDPQQALFWTRKAAEAGNADAQYDLAVHYYNGFGGLPEDQGQVMRWMRMAAENGHATSQDNIGLSYYQGSNGYSKDLAEAARWFRKAAEQGYADGQVNYGTSVWHGEGVPMNHAEAVRWFRKAAEQGNAEGQFWLGNAYRRGMGVEFDVAQARRWLRASAGQGDENAQGLLRFMDEVDREFAQRQRIAQRESRPVPDGNSLWRQAQETMERQRRENCAAAAQGRNRVCDKW